MRRSLNSGILALGVIGLYYAWRNRYQIQRFLERQGIRTPLDTSNMVDTVRSGVSKVTGTLQNKADLLTASAEEASRKAI